MSRSIPDPVPAARVGTPAGVLAVRCSVAASAGCSSGSAVCSFCPRGDHLCRPVAAAGARVLLDEVAELGVGVRDALVGELGGGRRRDVLGLPGGARERAEHDEGPDRVDDGGDDDGPPAARRERDDGADHEQREERDREQDAVGREGLGEPAVPAMPLPAGVRRVARHADAIGADRLAELLGEDPVGFRTQ